MPRLAADTEIGAGKGRQTDTSTWSSNIFVDLIEFTFVCGLQHFKKPIFVLACNNKLS